MRCDVDFTALDCLVDALNEYRLIDPEFLPTIYKEIFIKQVYDSNAIEGNQYTLSEVVTIVIHNVVPTLYDNRSISDLLDIVNYKAAVEYVTKNYKKDIL